MKHECKFCGKAFSSAHYIGKKDYSCRECVVHCMTMCTTANVTTTSWHKEPCISCKLNPYRLRHTWDGERWVKND